MRAFTQADFIRGIAERVPRSEGGGGHRLNRLRDRDKHDTRRNRGPARQKYNATVMRLLKVHSELLYCGSRPDFTRSIRTSRANTPCSVWVLGATFPGLPGREHPTGDRDEAGPPLVLAQLLGPGRARRLLDRMRRATGWSFTSCWCAKATNRQAAGPDAAGCSCCARATVCFIGEKITGNFTLDPVKPEDAVIFLATGTGEAPHNYMLWELLRRGHRGRILSACCVRYRRDLGYRRHPRRTDAPLPQLHLSAADHAREPESQDQKSTSRT